MNPSIATELAPPEYTAVRHILTAPSLAGRCRPHIGADDFDWTAILAEAETMSGGQELLIRIAYDLWEAKGVVGVWELPRLLDRANFRRVITALELSRSDDPAHGASEVLRRAA